jgi:hypothetical protein
MERTFDVVIVGAGAAGLFCAAQAGQRGLSVALLDHARRLGEKIRISGGGRCNFTNLQADRPERFASEDPSFARATLRAYPPMRFVARVEAAGIGWHEKHRGQLFCDDSAERIVAMLRADADQAGAVTMHPCAVHEVEATGVDGAGPGRFRLRTDAGPIGARSLVVATGGLPVPKLGASDWGLRLARRFGLRVVEPRPALVPLTFAAAAWQPYAALAGVSLPVRISLPQAASAPAFDEDLLFTHRGLSGPAVLQASTYWRPGAALSIDLCPSVRLAAALLAARDGARRQLGSALADLVPRRLAQAWLADPALDDDPARPLAQRRLAELGNRTLAAVATRLHDWRLTPAGTEGWRTAEVMAGGVATDELDPRTLQARRMAGLYFVGEVVDVTGWLGGYNFQWAWASAVAAAKAIAAASRD